MPEKQGPQALSEHDLEGLEPFLGALTERARLPGVCDVCGREELVFPTCPDCTIERLAGVPHAA